MLRSVACLFSVVAFTGSALAQETIRTTVAEDFAPSVKVSGSVLVGLALGPLSGAADPRKLRISPAAGNRNTMVCFTARTRDGQYWAEAKLSGALIKGASATIEPEGGWKHLRDLSAYSLADFAAIVRVGDDCAVNPGLPAIPVVYSSGEAPVLNVFVNSQRSLSATARLEWPDGRTISGACQKASADIRSTAFDMTCTLPLPPATTGPLTLVIDRRARIGVVTEKFPVLMPAQ